MGMLLQLDDLPCGVNSVAHRVLEMHGIRLIASGPEPGAPARLSGDPYESDAAQWASDLSAGLADVIPGYEAADDAVVLRLETVAQDLLAMGETMLRWQDTLACVFAAAEAKGSVDVLEIEPGLITRYRIGANRWASASLVTAGQLAPDCERRLAAAFESRSLDAIVIARIAEGLGPAPQGTYDRGFADGVRRTASALAPEGFAPNEIMDCVEGALEAFGNNEPEPDGPHGAGYADAVDSMLLIAESPRKAGPLTPFGWRIREVLGVLPDHEATGPGPGVQPMGPR